MKTHEFWSSRATLGVEAGTRDVIAKLLEIEFLCEFIRDGMRILDAGCGNGLTALEMARRAKVHVVGVDNVADMVDAATRERANARLLGEAEFVVGDVSALSSGLGEFDLVFTERTIINLPDWATQAQAIQSITARIRTGGMYVMVENSLDAVHRLNGLRAGIGLPEIVPPWHNHYLLEEKVKSLRVPGLHLREIRQYSSTYYFLSRIVNAALAAAKSEEPDYRSPINELALHLPGNLCDGLGQGVAWIWERDR